MDLITYEALYEILRNEKFSSELQPLNKEFYNQTINYLKEKRSIIDSQEKKTDIFSITEMQKTKRQLENIKKILAELHDIREKKVMELALYSSRSNEDFKSINMTENEVNLFNNIKEFLDINRKDVLLNLIEGKLPKSNLEKTKELKTIQVEKTKKLVRFIKTTPKFIAEDLNTYGPFETEDVANIPVMAAGLLIKNKKAHEI
nr:hypothetical protein [Candidatus Woesearchaeota archaeon]